jgi:hypothetical protein
MPDLPEEPGVELPPPDPTRSRRVRAIIGCMVLLGLLMAMFNLGRRSMFQEIANALYGEQQSAASSDYQTPGDAVRWAMNLEDRLGIENFKDVYRRYGGDPDMTASNGCTILFLAINNGHDDIARFLVEEGADVNRSSDYPDDLTPVYAASFQNNPEMLRYLIAHGASVNSESSRQASPIEKAAEFEHMECLKILVDHGARMSFDNFIELWRYGLRSADYLKDSGAVFDPKTGLQADLSFLNRPAIVAMRHFDAILPGMTDKAAIALVGWEPTQVTKHPDPIGTATYTWENEDTTNLEIEIEDERVTEKSQHGLREHHSSSGEVLLQPRPSAIPGSQERLSTGITYGQTVEILGAEGFLAFTMGDGPTRLERHEWFVNGQVFRCIFEGGKLKRWEWGIDTP